MALDVDRCDALLAQARLAAPVEALPLLAEADQLVRGEYLAGLDYPWLVGERRRIGEAHAEALSWSAELQLRQGNADAAVLTARRLGALGPYSERACVLELRSLAKLGDLAAAERRFAEFQALLEAELGVQPADATVTAYRNLRAEGL